MTTNRAQYRMPDADRLTVRDLRISPEPNTGCWLWLGALCRGYGHVGVTRGGRFKTLIAHRAVWEHHRGPIPDGMVLDHICRVRSCVNPDHIRVVTPRENTLRNSIGLAVRHAAKTCCPSCGAAYTVCRQRGGPRRVCLSCSRRNKRAYQMRVREDPVRREEARVKRHLRWLATKSSRQKQPMEAP